MLNFKKSLVSSAVAFVAFFSFLSLGLSTARADLGPLKQELSEAVRFMPESSPDLHEKLFDAGIQFEAAGIYSQARRYYKFLDILWEKHPPADPARHQDLKAAIAALKKKQDAPKAGIASVKAEDSIAFFQRVYYPEQILECQITRKESKGFWIQIQPESGPDKTLVPYLYPARSLGRTIEIPLPKTPGNYALNIHDSQGGFLTSEKIVVKPGPSWAGKLQVETSGFPGLGGTAIKPGKEFKALVHNTPAWKQGVAGKKPWVGLFKKETPLTSDRYVTYWSIHQKKEFTHIKYRIKAPGQYQLRVFNEDSNAKELLLVTDLTVGTPVPVRTANRFSAQGGALVFDKKQEIRIQGNHLGLNESDRPDPYCILVPSWFSPMDIRHGLNHSLATVKGGSPRSVKTIRLPDTCGEFDIIFYPHWTALEKKADPVQLARVRVGQQESIHLVLTDEPHLPGANIRAGLRVNGEFFNLDAYILPLQHLQVRANRAGSLRNNNHRASLTPAQYGKGWAWFNITAPMVPGPYVLAVYDKRVLQAAQPIQVMERGTKGARIIVAKGPYKTGAPFLFNAFPPETGMPKHGVALFLKDGVTAAKKNLYAQYMDLPNKVQAPGDPGTYEILFHVNGREEPVAKASAEFFSDLPEPRGKDNAQPINPKVAAAFNADALLPRADMAEFHLFAEDVVPGQELFISYSLPSRVPACMVLVESGRAPDSISQAIKKALLVREMDGRKDLVSFKAPGPGSYDILFYDTLQWFKAGPPKEITRIPVTVKDVFRTQVAYPKTAYAHGDLVIRLTQDPDPGFEKAHKEIRLYRSHINMDKSGAAAAKGGFVKITRNVFHARLRLNLDPGNYQFKINGITYPVRLVKNPRTSGNASVSLVDEVLMPRGMATVELHPAASWKGTVAWAVAAKDEQGQFNFLKAPGIIKQKDRAVQTLVTAPERPGEYRICLWDGTGRDDYKELPDSAVFSPLHVRMTKAYEAAHKPDVTLQAYFASDDTLYAGMYTSGRYTASISYDNSAWIGLLPMDPPAATLDSGAARKSALWKKAINGKDQGEFSFMAPMEPGRYQLCMFDSAKNGRLVLHQDITLNIPDLARLEQDAEKEADAYLEALPDYEEDIQSIKDGFKKIYKQNLEVPTLTPIPVPPELFEQLQSGIDGKDPALAARILDLLGPSEACAADPRKCEADIDLTLENMRRVNINFGDGVNVRKVVGQMAAQMASDLVMGQQHIAKAKQYFDQSKGYYDQAMKLKASADKHGWEKTVKGALWNSTEAMLKSCVTTGCMSKLGKKAIEYKIKAYNPKKMTRAEQDAWKKEYAGMVVLLNDADLEAIKQKTAKYADLAGQLAVPDPSTKAIEMAKAHAINTMKGVTMSMVSKIPGWPAVKAYYESLVVLRGALIQNETVNFMDEYRKLRDEGGTISQVNDILAGKQINYLRTSLRDRIEKNPKGYKEYLTYANKKRMYAGKPINLSVAEIEKAIMGYMEKWYQQERKDNNQDRFYQEMKDAWYNSQCQFDSYKAVIKSKNAFDTTSEVVSHAYGKLSGFLTGDKTFSSISCARKALAFKNYMDLRSQVVREMAGWKGKDRRCNPGTRENQRLQDQLVCDALFNPDAFKEAMADNAEACGKLPRPMPARKSRKVKQLSKKASRAVEVLLRRSGNIKVLQCLCNRYSFMGSGCSYHPGPTKGRSPACDKAGPPCIQGNWGCGRKALPTDRASLEACNVGKSIREFKKKDNKAYQKWLRDRKQYMSQ